MTAKYFVPPILFFRIDSTCIRLAYSNIIVHNRCSNDSLKQTTKTLLTKTIITTWLPIPKSRDYKDEKSASCIVINCESTLIVTILCTQLFFK